MISYDKLIGTLTKKNSWKRTIQNISTDAKTTAKLNLKCEVIYLHISCANSLS